MNLRVDNDKIWKWHTQPAADRQYKPDKKQ